MHAVCHPCLQDGATVEAGLESLAGLRSLQRIGLGGCLGDTLPAAVSCLTALMLLNLGTSKELSSGWEHLAPWHHTCSACACMAYRLTSHRS